MTTEAESLFVMGPSDTDFLSEDQVSIAPPPGEPWLVIDDPLTVEQAAKMGQKMGEHIESKITGFVEDALAVDDVLAADVAQEIAPLLAGELPTQLELIPEAEPRRELTPDERTAAAHEIVERLKGVGCSEIRDVFLDFAKWPESFGLTAPESRRDGTVRVWHEGALVGLQFGGEAPVSFSVAGARDLALKLFNAAAQVEAEATVESEQLVLAPMEAEPVESAP